MVEIGLWFTFQPIENQLDTGLIFYPCGHVDAHAYDPSILAIAQKGYLSVIV